MTSLCSDCPQREQVAVLEHPLTNVSGIDILSDHAIGSQLWGNSKR